MDILSNIPTLVADKSPELDETSELDITHKNVKFHRDNVRNGPANFKGQSTGQIRRAKQRVLDGQTRRARRRQIKTFLEHQREASTLRGQLQAAGVVAYNSPDFTIAPRQALASIVWIVQRYADAPDGARVDVTYDVVIASLQAAMNRYEDLIGSPRSTMDPEYILPVEVSE